MPIGLSNLEKVQFRDKPRDKPWNKPWNENLSASRAERKGEKTQKRNPTNSFLFKIMIDKQINNKYI